MAQTLQQKSFGTMVASSSTQPPKRGPGNNQSGTNFSSGNNQQEGFISSVVNDIQKNPLEHIGKELLKDFLFFTPIGWLVLASAGVGLLIYKFWAQIAGFSTGTYNSIMNDINELFFRSK